MRWKKNTVSYLAWGLYLLAVCFVYGSLLIEINNRWMGNSLAAVSLTAAIFFMLIVVYTGIRRPVSRGRLRSGKYKEFIQKAEKMVIPIFFIIGALLRVLYQIDLSKDNASIEIVQIMESQEALQTSTIARLYFHFLQSLYSMAGENWEVIIWFQIIIQIIAYILCYIGVRKLTGSVTAMLMFGFLMLMPRNIKEVITYSPSIFYFCIYAVSFFCVALFLRKQAAGKICCSYHWIFVFFTGIFTGVTSFFHIVGITLLGLAASVLWLRQNKAKNIWGKRIFNFIIYLLGAAAGFFCSFFFEVLSSGKTFSEIGKIWFFLPQIETLYFDFWKPSGSEIIISLILYTILFLGIFSFWNRKLSEKISPWVIMLIPICFLEIFSISTGEINYSSFRFWIITILAGIAMEDCFYHDKHRSLKERKEDREDEKFVMYYQDEETKKPSSKEDKSSVSEKKEEIQYLDNPLPLPKKHKKKVMNYNFEPKEKEMDFDIDISEEDDFDI